MTTDIFIVSYPPDYAWLARSLEVLKKNLTGYRDIHLVLQGQSNEAGLTEADLDGVNVHYAPGWEGAGYLHQQLLKMRADQYSDADYILHLDSEVFIDRTTHVQDYFVSGKPSWLWNYYTDMGPEVPWQTPTIKATGLPCEREFMAGFPFVIDRRTYPRVRQWIEDHTGKPVEQYLKECAKRGNTSFSEFNAMGAIAFEAQHELYWWVDRNRDQWPKGFHSTRQFWSHRSVTDHKEAIDQMLSQDTTQQLRTTNRGIWVLTNDTHISRWVEQHGRLDFDGHLLPRVLPYIKSGMTVVDVGAFIGDHTHAYAKAVLGNDAEGNPITTGRVLAFEPNPITFEALSRNMQGHGHVECINKGLSSAPGRMSVSQSPNAGAAFLVSGNEVEVTTLDSYGLHACDLIKIDAEGLEFSILQGAWQTIARHNPVLVLEINLGALDRQGVIPEDIYGWLKLRGYKHIDGIEGGTQFDIIAHK